MATKKHKTGNRTRTKKRTKRSATPESVPPVTSIAHVDPAIDAPKLDASLDLTEVQVRGPEAEEAVEELQQGEQEEAETRSAGQAGSLQGLSDLAEAAPESVVELLEEGNPLEAEIVEGVEDAPDADESEVKTHEVPEDDVLGEYLDTEQ
jgi:hypothetical protein